MKAFALTLLVFLSFSTGRADFKTEDLKKLQVPKGFHVEILVPHIPNAREMNWAHGILYVGTREEGKVYGVVGLSAEASTAHPKLRAAVITIASGLNQPNGVAFKDGSLYVAEIHRIIRFDNIEEALRKAQASGASSLDVKPVVVFDKLPSEKWHGWKFIAFGPGGWLYVPIGMPCNVCTQKDERFGTISRVKPDGTDFQIYAHGVRNSVGFDFDPKTQDLWFTDNGRDNMGDNLPPDELNWAAKQGQDFGFPRCDGKSIVDPEFGKSGDCLNIRKPEVEFPAHVATLGMRFYTGKMFPADYKNSIFVAEHGSWNRSTPIGYQVVNVTHDEKTVYRVKPFVSGWLDGIKTIGRPVDVLVWDDGSLLISDDFSGTIYRVSYKNKNPPSFSDGGHVLVKFHFLVNPMS